jgi:hypothetical protein
MQNKPSLGAPTKSEHHNGQIGNVENGQPQYHHIFPSSDGTDTNVFDTEEKRHMAVVDPDLFPDGGLEAWTVVGASFLLVFCTFGTAIRELIYEGIVNGFGIFQTYLLQHQLNNYSQDAVAWIGSVQISLSFFGGLISGRNMRLNSFN